MVESRHPVQIYKYILGSHFGVFIAKKVVGIASEGPYHTGLVAYGQEFFFGSDGIKSCQPQGFKLAELIEVIDVGETDIPLEQFKQYLAQLSKSRYTSQNYSVFKNNCNHFTDDMAKFLTGQGVPKIILDQPAEVLSKPMGIVLAPVFQLIPDTIKLLRHCAHNLLPAAIKIVRQCANSMLLVFSNSYKCIK
eukprot:TRINITY_DN25419_c0_g1_i1.p1 TRINITY_DN25419_c0_g1~~TRINITY_DN25419_c0_g1_i1.p1  ORF type:complete len:192 (-),score=19.42 TRINITY_DN25419_c0_g1_i1:27-602(-)